MVMKSSKAIVNTLVSIVVVVAGIVLFNLLIQGLMRVEGGGVYASPLALFLSALAMYRFTKGSKSWKLGFFDFHAGRNFLLGGLTGMLLVGSSILLMGLDGQIRLMENDIDQSSILLLVLLFAMIAFGEEVFFRGYLYGMYESLFPSRMAILLSSLLFSIVHLINPGTFSKPPLFLVFEISNIFLLGLLFGLARYYSKSLWFPISLHLMINFMQSAVFGFLNGGKETPSISSVEYRGMTLLNGGGHGFESSLAATIVLTIILLFFKFIGRSK